MSNFSPVNSFANYLEVNKDFPAEWNEFLGKFLDTYRDIANAVNLRDIALYDTQEIIIGRKFFPSTTSTNVSRLYRETFRKVIDMGTVVTGLNTVAHNIDVNTPSDFTFTNIYGVVQDKAASLFVTAPNDNIHLEVDSTNVRLTIPALYNNFTAIVILEYLKN